jgi:hypothetical protein
MRGSDGLKVEFYLLICSAVWIAELVTMFWLAVVDVYLVLLANEKCCF